MNLNTFRISLLLSLILMRIRTGVILAYLLLSCILLEDALPYFAQANKMECFEYKSDGNTKESKKQKDFEDEIKLVHERFSFESLLPVLETETNEVIHVAFERIPDSIKLGIFSPPPNQV